MSSLMRSIRGAAGFLAAAAALVFAQAPAEKIAPPLVRRDLVRTAARTFPEIKRDLFSTARFSASFAAGQPAGFMPGGGMPPVGEPPPPPPAVVRYVGYIKYAAADKPVALVLINGEAWAVLEGETLGNGWTAVRVTENEVELRDPEGKNQVFLYQPGQGEGS
ncbi:MAG: hypothetical protein JW843_07300 [Candidatus Aminicenantes bacterium]|nr:hypothetical protein [Candidatus Aminicenantes bacterium]